MNQKRTTTIKNKCLMMLRFTIYSGSDVETWIPTLAQLAERRTVDVIDFLRSLVRLRQVGSFFNEYDK